VYQLLDYIDRAIKDIAAGRPVLVVDDENRENEGDIIFAASLATPELLAFMIRYTSGVICVPMREAELDRLNLPQMTSRNTEQHRTAFTVSVDAKDGISLTVSALGPPGGETWFEVCLIPETLKRTTMGARQPGEVVNLEVDVIAKYVERLLSGEASK